MTSTETILFAGCLLSIGMTVGARLNDWGVIDRCEKYGTTLVLNTQIKCEIVETKKP